MYFFKMRGINPKELIVEAREFEVEGFLLEATRKYDEAIDILKEMIASTQNAEKKMQFLIKIEVLEDYLLKVKNRIETSNRSAKTIKIPENATGFSYDKLFGTFLNDTIREVHIYESYTFEEQQIENLVSFFDLLIKRCKNLRFICLFTKKIYPNPNHENRKKQDFKLRMAAFNHWIKQFRELNIVFLYRLKKKIHDRRVELGNGTTFVLGYGLDIYQYQQRFSLGTSDFSLRKCKETYVEILQPVHEDCMENEHLI